MKTDIITTRFQVAIIHFFASVIAYCILSLMLNGEWRDSLPTLFKINLIIQLSLSLAFLLYGISKKTIVFNLLSSLAIPALFFWAVSGISYL